MNEVPADANGRYRYYVLAALTTVYTLSFIDRCLMLLLLQPIKEDLGLSDTQLGFVTGIAFGIFYATLGVPIARWADRGDRVKITSIAIAVWGAIVMASILIMNFWQLVLARVAASVGEAGAMPPTYSLIGDYFPKPDDRTRAMAIYMMASPISVLVSFILGGWISDRYGWRQAFFWMGLPALLVAVVCWVTIVEPRRRGRQAALIVQRVPPRFVDVLSQLWLQRSTRHIGIAFILLLTLGLGLAPWYSAFLMRSHGLGTSEVGTWLGLVFGVSGAVGILLGGYANARWFAESPRSQMRLSSTVVAFLVPFYLLFLLLPDKRLALLAMAPLQVAFNFFLGPTLALMQRLVTSDARATSLSVVMLLANLIGMGLGPQVVGILSDALLPTMGADSLRYSMLLMTFIALWAAFHFWRAGAFIDDDLRRNSARMAGG